MESVLTFPINLQSRDVHGSGDRILTGGRVQLFRLELQTLMN